MPVAARSVCPLALVRGRVRLEEPELSARLSSARAARPGFLRDRGLRVTALLTAIVGLSVIDLALTLEYLQTIGLAEANPLARAVMNTGSGSLLAAWKFASILPVVLLALAHRRRMIAEIAAWVGFAVLVVVTVRWHLYAEGADELMLAMPLLVAGEEPYWVAAMATE